MLNEEIIYKEYKEKLLEKVNTPNSKFSFDFVNDTEGTFTITDTRTKDVHTGNVKLTVANESLNILMDCKGFYLSQSIKIENTDPKNSTHFTRDENKGKVFLTGFDPSLYQ